MNNYFINFTKHLNLKPHTVSNTMDIEQIASALKQSLVSIMKIREIFREISSNSFKFIRVTEESVKSEALKLNTQTSSTSGSIPATILKLLKLIYLF